MKLFALASSPLAGPTAVVALTGPHPSTSLTASLHFFSAVLLTLGTPLLVAFAAIEVVDLLQDRRHRNIGPGGPSGKVGHGRYRPHGTPRPQAERPR